MKIVVTGSNGQLGLSLSERFPLNWQVFSFDSKELDISDEKKVFNLIYKLKPNVIINTAAYTAVDKAEEDIEFAKIVNHFSVRHLAVAAKQINAKLIHISTDYVFDGDSKIPYSENDMTNPQSVYGITKLGGEQVIEEILSDYLIFRTSWVFSEHGNNFYKTMLRLFMERDTLSVVSDQIGKPTYAGDLANAIISALEKNIPAGTYHYSGDKTASWYDFAKFIYEQFNKKFDKTVELKAITSDEFPQRAKRPIYSVMTNQKIEQYNIVSSDWQGAITSLMFNN